MGVIHQTIHYLYPEEVCFLVEEGTAEVYIGEQLVDSKVIIQLKIDYIGIPWWVFNQIGSTFVLHSLSWIT